MLGGWVLAAGFAGLLGASEGFASPPEDSAFRNQFEPLLVGDGGLLFEASGLPGVEGWPDCSGGRPGLDLPCNQWVLQQKGGLSIVSRAPDGALVNGSFEGYASPGGQWWAARVLAEGWRDAAPAAQLFQRRGLDGEWGPLARLPDGSPLPPYSPAAYPDLGTACRTWCGEISLTDEGLAAFDVWNPGLVEEDGNEWPDVYLAGGDGLELVSGAGDGPSWVDHPAALDRAGLRLAFVSRSTTLYSGDLPTCPAPRVAGLPAMACPQVYLYDVATGAVDLVGLTADGRPAPLGAHSAGLSGDGIHLVFVSTSDMKTGEALAAPAVWRRNLATGRLDLVSHPEVESWSPRVSADGGRVAYLSGSRPAPQAYVWEAGAARVASEGVPHRRPGSAVGHLAMSPDGEWLAFTVDVAAGGDGDPEWRVFLRKPDATPAGPQGIPAGPAPVAALCVILGLGALRRRGQCPDDPLSPQLRERQSS